MQIEVRLFAAAAQAAGARAVVVSLERGGDLHTLSQALIQAYPELEGLLPVSRWAVDHQFVPLDTQLAADQEVALIPPVSGG